jgi:Gas vesicle synthesis protein GvpL/GvpF
VEAVTTVPAETVLYLYGFVRPTLDAAGLAAGPADVILVEDGDVACAASVVPAVDYHVPSDANTAARQLEWVAPRAWRHHEVLRHLHAAGGVVPLKFGTLCSDEQHVVEMLRRRRDPILALLAELEGKDEWTLNMRSDAELLAAVVRHTDPELAALAADADRLPEGHAYFARKKVQKATCNAVAARLAAVRNNLHERLADAAISFRAADQPPTATSEGAISSLAVLVCHSRLSELEALLADLEAAHAEAHVTFELVGPWPPYSFAAVLEP